MESRLRKFIKLPAPDRGLLAAAVIALVKARVTVAFVPIRKILRPVTPRTAAGFPDADAARIGWAVEAASRVVPSAKNCLVRAIAGRELLARHGFSSQIQLGIGKNPADTLRGHAWLECGEMIITGEGEHLDFVAMPVRDDGGENGRLAS
jgi:Transglutaminase-like superfamily